MKDFELGRDLGFIISVPPEAIRKEKEKARVLRKSQWWRRQIDRGECYYCRQALRPEELTMDHIVPLIRGGRSTRGNVVPACKECNNRKRYLLPIEWDEFLTNLRGSASSCEETSDVQESGGKKDE